MTGLENARVLVRLGLRSIWSHRVKSLIVGGILAFGTFLLVLGSTMLENVERSMARSITGSLIGHLQVFSEDAKDTIAFYGPAAGSQQDLGVIRDWPKVREALERIPNVASVVPMGRDVGQAMGGNDLDVTLTALRDAVKAEDKALVSATRQRVLQLAELIRVDLDNRATISSRTEEIAQGRVTVDRALSPEFWAEFEADPLPALDWLDTTLAPLQADDTAIFLPYVGTDLQQFAREFSNFEIVDGTMVPPGERGFLFNKPYFDEVAKNQVARLLDLMKKARADGDRFATHPKLQEQQKRVVRLARTLLFAVKPQDEAALSADLEQLVGAEGGLRERLERLVTVDDGNFDDRFDAFYRIVAPRIELYRVKVGDELTIRAFTRSGYTRAANIKVYGTFHFKGMDDSLLASRYCLTDIMTFRDLFGLMTPERKRELDAIRAAVGVEDVARDDAEDALFGDPDELVAEVETVVADAVEAQPVEVPFDETPTVTTFTQADIDNGVVINAAITLVDADKLPETQAAIQKVNEELGLGLKVIHWQEAAGIIGQFLFVMRVVLIVAILVIFLVALVIINNSMLMATMDRIQEIGTMRAIGAQRGFVLAMFLIETTALAVVSGAFGALLAAGAIKAMAVNGLPAAHEVLVVLFGGPRLFPELDTGSTLLGLALIAIVSVLATLYPAVVATRIQPIVAMQRKE